ncbi:opioid growth factor receptor-like [Nematolebias whitei]|uniref:opioid growth factor receptor-like n=1 Tax=Nematolebias whitei TaxID=451745 RepID=UPI0018995D49|nr:opioid growth factor receptor-like [Nematolebias whitei]
MWERLGLLEEIRESWLVMNIECPPQMSCTYKFSRFKSAAKDMQNYRHNYPVDRPNLMFYVGEAPCLPDGIFIKEIHSHWWGNYDKLESVHTYIQWLFPLQEPGMNYQASILTKQEIKDFSQSNLAKQNLLRSYNLMLDFYGIELEDVTTGAVRRAENWLDRFDNLNRRTHNNLRITRILKCLGTLGYRHYQAPLVRFFLEETLVHGELPNVKESVLNYFVFAVLDKTERRQLLRFAYTNYTPKEEFVWCPVKIQKTWSWMQGEGPGSECDHDGSEDLIQVQVIDGSS